MWWPFFIVGSFWFWGLALVEAVLIICFVEFEKGWATFWSLIAFVLLIHLFGDAHIFKYIHENPMKILMWGLVYIGIGFGWSALKLRLALSKYRDKIEDMRMRWVENGNNKNDDDAWKEYLRNNTNSYDIPRFSEYKEKIVFWWAYWPPSMFWSFFRDFFERFFRWMVRITKKFYLWIFDATVGKVISEIQDAKHGTPKTSRDF